MSDISSIRSKIASALSQRDTSRQYKETYNQEAQKFDDQASSYAAQGVVSRDRASRYEAEELQAQKDLDYYSVQAAQAEQEATRAKYEAQT